MKRIENFIINQSVVQALICTFYQESFKSRKIHGLASVKYPTKITTGHFYHFASSSVNVSYQTTVYSIKITIGHFDHFGSSSVNVSYQTIA